MDFEAGLFADGIDRCKIVDVEHGDLERRAILAEGDDVVRAGDRLRNERENVGRNVLVFKVYEGNAEHIRLNAAQCVVTNSPTTDENVSKCLPAFLRLSVGVLNISARDEPRVDDEFFELPR